ncbi:MAG: hypothetical protein R3Y10_11995 [Ferrimonas sp.]
MLGLSACQQETSIYTSIENPEVALEIPALTASAVAISETELQGQLQTTSHWSYQSGALIKVRLTNNKRGAQTVMLRSGMALTASLWQRGQLRWRLGDYLMASQALMPLTLAAAEERTLLVDIAPAWLAGVAAGEYELRVAFSPLNSKQLPYWPPLMITLEN